MFHFQQLFAVNWIEFDQLEIKPKKPESITDTDLGFLSEILGNAKTVTNLTLDFRMCKEITDGGVTKIKEALTGLPTLKKMRLNFKDCNKMSDTSIGYLMEAISQHTAIEDFSIILEGCDMVKGVGLFAVLKGLKALSNLTSLELTPPKISDGLMDELQHTVSGLEKLVTLNLSFGAKQKKEGSLSDKGFSELAAAIASLPKLEHLYLDMFRGEWTISDNGLVKLGEALDKQVNLLSLRLNLRGIDYISDVGVGYIFDALTKLKKLKKLHLNFKSDREDNIFELKKPLAGLVDLKQLNLDFSWGVSDATIIELKQAFAKLGSLTQLYMNFSGCKAITDQGLVELKGIIMNLPSLTDLRLEFPWCYAITDEGAGHLAEAISSRTALTNLKLDFERGKKDSDQSDEQDLLTNNGICDIFGALTELANLKVLNLNLANCATLTDDDVLVLGQSLSKFEKLGNLTVDFKLCDKLTDQAIDYIRDGLQDLPNLNNVLLNFLWCGAVSEKSIMRLLDLKKSKKIPQFLIAYRKDEPPAEEGGCNMF